MTADLWTDYSLTLEVGTLVGGIPRHPSIVSRWQEAKWPKDPTSLVAGDPQTPGEAAEATIEALGSQAMSADDVAAVWTGFLEQDGQLVIEGRQIKAALKESANICRPLLPKSAKDKDQPWKARLAERVFVNPKFIPLHRAEPDETIERPIHVFTAQGPRTALKRTDILHKVSVACTLRVLNDGFVTEPALQVILDHASENGIGTDRSQGNGTFTYTLSRL